MNHNKFLTTSLAIALFFAPLVHAESAELGGQTVKYDEVLEADSTGDGQNDRISYYRDGELVFTTYDTDADGSPDLFFAINEDWELEWEGYDTDGDGQVDEAYQVNSDEKATSLGEGEGDVVGEDRPERSGGGGGALVLAAVVVIGAVLLMKKKKRKKH